jgi:DNA-binding protein H-NS
MENKTLAQLQEKYNKLEADFKSERTILEKQIAEARKHEQANALAQIRSIMNEFGIDPTDIGVGKKTRKSSGKSRPVAAKYRGPNGETWSGRGRQPRWLGDDPKKFLIKD